MINIDQLLQTAESARQQLGENYHDKIVETNFTHSAHITDLHVTHDGKKARFHFDTFLDNLLTSRLWGFPVMFLLFFAVFWLTIAGANIPSGLLGELLLGTVYTWLHQSAELLHLPHWLSGFLIDGVYMATAWVIAVMLPPMAIFFPLFTLLEDFGYLPRVAFNLDRLFQRSGAHGKQALTMMMGFGCNAAGVVSTRIIDSPRERLIAIITNNFSICNGRWPTLILMGTIFIGALVPPAFAGLIAAASVVIVAIIGIGFSLLVSAALTRTWLKGETSTFSLELPPYRPPQVWRTLYTSLIDRTLIVLWRAVQMAAPAGALIWLTSNITIGDYSIAAYIVQGLNPIGLFFGLNGVILTAYLLAIPANEIIIPTILMLTLTLGKNVAGAQAGVMLELDEYEIYRVLTDVGGWSLLTAINLMLFSLLHNPCSTTIMTIWHETKSAKWTTIATLLPLGLGFLVTGIIANIARLLF